MGYESKLYVVEKHEPMGNETRRYAQVIAAYDICKFDFFTDNVFQKETDCYIYADDGNTEITKDCYGDLLKEANIESVIECLEKYNNTGEHYRRVMPLLGLLKGFDPTEWENLMVLHYGH